MFLDPFFSEKENCIHFTRQQASNFAKDVADDFNPLHDIDAKRFCVPGDLLFAAVLNKYGLSQHMQFSFAGMVTDKTPIIFPKTENENVIFLDDREKEYLSIERSGEHSLNAQLIQDFTLSYIHFSGHTFLDVLIPLMAEHNVMINPDRPMVIYESMTFNLNHLNFTDPSLEFVGASLAIDGKRGNVLLEFALTAEGKAVGKGEKKMVMAGLREYDADTVTKLVGFYKDLKQSYKDSQLPG